MHLRSALVLSIVVFGLGILVWKRQGSEQRRRVEADGPLLSGLNREALDALRIDHLERDLHLRMERTEDGAWQITDPLRYPADGAVVTLLLDALFLNRAQPFEGAEEGLGLRPPRVVVELEERATDAPRIRRIEVGAVDLDGQHVFARVDGRVVRTLRNLDSALERELPDWRQRMLLGVSPGAIAELHRRGRSPEGAGGTDLTLDASVDGGWSATSPWQAALAPEAVGALLTSLAYLRVAGFEDDAPGPLEVYGLEPPDLRVEINMATGQNHALRFAYLPGSDRLRCLLEGSPHVYLVDSQATVWLTAPAEALVDLELVRVRRDSVTRLRLSADGRETVLERKGFAWFVTARGGSGPELEREKADAQLVADLLGRIEAARVVELLAGVEFPSTAGEQGIYVEAGGEELGGAIGPPFESSRGTQGLLFRRAGDTLVGLVDASLLEIARADPEGLRSKELHRVAELDVAQIQVAAPLAGVARSWRRSNAGRWTPEGSEAEARDLAEIIEALLTVRALAFPAAGESGTGGQPVEVEFLDRDGAHLARFSLATLSGGLEEIDSMRVLYVSGARRGVLDGSLYQGLLRLLGLD